MRISWERKAGKKEGRREGGRKVKGFASGN